MPVFNNSIEKLVMGRMNLAPAPMLDLIGGFSFYAVAAAVELGLFEALKNRQMSTTELAAAVNCDARGLDTLMELLETLGYVRLKNGRYKLTPMTLKWMLVSSETYFGEGFIYYKRLMTDIWQFIAESMKKGDAYINFYEWLRDFPDTAESYQKFMMSLASMMLPELVKKIKFTDESILDVGGSHGLYSIALCRRNPGITITIIDSDYAMPLLKNNVTGAGMEQRIKLLTADFMTHEFAEKFDTILLFNVLHEHREGENMDLLKKIKGTLKPGGSLLILDGIKEKKISRLADLGVRMYSLLFYHFLGGRNYSYNEISSWLNIAGFGKVKRIELRMSGFTIIRAHD